MSGAVRPRRRPHHIRAGKPRRDVSAAVGPEQRLAVFAYGSLVWRQSAAETLGRPVELLPATLRGWQRRYSVARDNLHGEKTFARRHDGSLPAFVLVLNLEPATGPRVDPNGALIEVSAAELARLDIREGRYARIEVTDSLALPAADGPRPPERVFTYVARDDTLATAPPENAIVPATYVAAVERGFAELGPGELDRYRESTGPPPLEPVAVDLVSATAPAGNPLSW